MFLPKILETLVLKNEVHNVLLRASYFLEISSQINKYILCFAYSEFAMF